MTPDKIAEEILKEYPFYLVAGIQIIGYDASKTKPDLRLLMLADAYLKQAEMLRVAKEALERITVSYGIERAQEAMDAIAKLERGDV